MESLSGMNIQISAGISRRIVFLLILASFFSSCRLKPTDEWESKEYKYNFNPAEYKKCLQERITKKDSTLLFQFSDLEYSDSLKKFYTARDFHPAVMKSFEDSASVFSLLNVILNVKEHGLNPEMYRYNTIIKELSAFYDTRKTNTQSAYHHMVNTELLLANAIVKYTHDVRFGVVSPAKIFRGSYFLPLADSGKSSALKPLYQENILKYLNSVQPSNQRYKRMQAALKYFESLDNSEWDSIPAVNPGLKLVARRLSQLGFLDKDKVSADSINAKDSLFVKAIVNFQKANGLKSNGSIGKETIAKLNTPLKKYIEKIKLNMERFRWTTYADSSSRYILVNIPEFYLHAVENGEENMNIKVCTGKKFVSVKNNCETPQLFGRISYMVLNPTWTVPPSIVRKEIWGETVKDANYLRKKNFKVYKNGKRVDISSIQLAKYSPSHVPYTFVQNPGDGNALGKIKFMFDNSFSIYLHDTPTRAPFSQANRAVSHGCVRVEKPFDLAEYILKDNSKWTADFVRLETGNKVSDSTVVMEFKKMRHELRREGADGKTTRVNLKSKIPLYIDYFTAWVTPEGYINLRDDVYNKDEILKEYFPLK